MRVISGPNAVVVDPKPGNLTVELTPEDIAVLWLAFYHVGGSGGGLLWPEINNLIRRYNWNNLAHFLPKPSPASMYINTPTEANWWVKAKVG